MTSISTINVPFHGDNLYVVNYNGQPYVPMKPIVEGMGLAWGAQFAKLKQRFSSSVSEIEMVAEDGKLRNMVCIALRKLSGWLHTISPNKVKPEIRDKVIRYQEECDDVLYEYWTTGEVKNKRKAQKTLPGKITAEQQEAIKQLVMTRGKALPKEKQAKAMITMWSSLKSHFGCTYKEIGSDKFTEALSLAARVPLEGEYIPAQEALPVPKLDINYPLTWYPDNFPYVDMCFYKQGQLRMTRSMLAETRSPSSEIFSKLKAGGYDIAAAEAEVATLRHFVTELSWAIDSIGGFVQMRDRIDKTFTA
ncbi:phage antirepressor N-terminal domain-containing protein [Morganella morganii]